MDILIGRAPTPEICHENGPTFHWLLQNSPSYYFRKARKLAAGDFAPNRRSAAQGRCRRPCLPAESREQTERSSVSDDQRASTNLSGRQGEKPPPRARRARAYITDAALAALPRVPGDDAIWDASLLEEMREPDKWY
jgi:hypothetical protein